MDKEWKESLMCHHSGSKQEHQKPDENDECGGLLYSHLSVLNSSVICVWLTWKIRMVPTQTCNY